MPLSQDPYSAMYLGSTQFNSDVCTIIPLCSFLDSQARSFLIWANGSPVPARNGFFSRCEASRDNSHTILLQIVRCPGNVQHPTQKWQRVEKKKENNKEKGKKEKGKKEKTQPCKDKAKNTIRHSFQKIYIIRAVSLHINNIQHFSFYCNSLLL